MRGVNDEPLPRIPCLGADLGWNAGWSCFCRQSFGGRLGNGNPAVSSGSWNRRAGVLNAKTGIPYIFYRNFILRRTTDMRPFGIQAFRQTASIFSLANGDQNKQAAQ